MFNIQRLKTTALQLHKTLCVRSECQTVNGVCTRHYETPWNKTFETSYILKPSAQVRTAVIEEITTICHIRKCSKLNPGNYRPI